jgi:hypothetical protein
VLDAAESSTELARETVEEESPVEPIEMTGEETTGKWQELEPDQPEPSSEILTPVPAPPPSPAPPRPASTVQTSGMAIASLVMGIAGWTVLPLLGSILAIVFGYAARNEIRRRPDQLTGEGLAVTGLVLGWLVVGLSVLALCLGVLGFCFFFGLAGANA